jgi:hypothetical protein
LIQIINEKQDLTTHHRLFSSLGLEHFVEATKKLSSTWLEKYNVEQNGYHGQERVLVSKEMNDAKRHWLKCITEVQKSMIYLAEVDKELTRYIIVNRYKLIFNSMIEFQHAAIFSKEELTTFLNTRPDENIILDYAINQYDHDIIKYRDAESGTRVLLNPWEIDIKHTMEISNSFEGFPELLKCE